MKKIVSLIMVAFAIVSVTLCASGECLAATGTLGDFQGYNTRLTYDSEGVFFIAHKSDSLYVCQLAPTRSETTASLEGKIVDCAVCKGVVYVISAMKTQKDCYYLYTVENGSVRQLSVIINFHMNNKPDMVVSDEGHIYLFDSKKRIAVFNKSGELLTRFADSVAAMFSLNSTAYAVGYKGIDKLSLSGAVKGYDYSDNCNIRAISSKHIVNNSGKVYEVADKLTLLFDTENTSAPFCGETDRYFISCGGKYLKAYGKTDGEAVDEYYIGFKPQYLLCYANKIYAVKKWDNSFAYYAYSADSVFPENNNENNGGETDLSFKQYKQQGKYIFVPQGTTTAKFKSSIDYGGYSAGFSATRGNVGTGDDVVFSKNGKEKKYIFVITGDVTGEGNINTRDRAAMLKHLLGTEKLGTPFKIGADLNGDGKVNNIDLVMLERSRD